MKRFIGETEQECSKCGKILPYSEFNKDKSKRSGYFSSCNNCRRKSNGAKKREDWNITADGRVCTSCKKWMTFDNFYKSRSSSGYRPKCIDCLREEGGHKKRIIRKITEDGMECSKCYKFLPFSDFYRIRSDDDVVTSYCKDCRRLRDGYSRRKKYKITADGRVCATCNQLLPFSEFYKDSSKYKHSIHCKRCRSTNIPASYKNYAHKLTVDENPIVANDGITMMVKCTYCGKHYVPLSWSVNRRIRALNNDNAGECRLYCSEGCKSECPVYGSTGNYTSSPLTREMIPAMRQAVLKRDGYKCTECGATEKLHCHHKVPIKIDPGKSEDTANGITLCKDCHIGVHKNTPGIGYGQLRALPSACQKPSDSTK